MARIGMLTPSSNTVLEPVTSKLTAELEGVTIHYSRIRVTAIKLGGDSDRQFSVEAMVEAAKLLADALVDVIVWNGTAGSWLGREYDIELCRRIREETGIPATTSTLAFEEAYKALSVKRVGLVTPYTADVNERIVERCSESGIGCVAHRCSGLHVNEQFAGVGFEEIGSMIDQVAEAGADAVAVVCTNMNAASLAVPYEEKHGIPMLDSVSVTAWQALRMAGVDTASLADRWGGIFRLK